MIALVAYQGIEYIFPLVFKELRISWLNWVVFSCGISCNAPLCARVEEKSGLRLTKSGGLSLRTEAKVLFSPSEKGTSTHLILMLGFSASNSFITPFIYGAKSFIWRVQKTTSLFSCFFEKTKNILVKSINVVTITIQKFLFKLIFLCKKYLPLL